eukprot:CFRG1705T1
MGYITFVRHGESVGNRKKILQGHLDLPLTDIGLAQAEVVAKYIASRKKIRTIYSSDLQRAAQTGKAVRRYIKPEVELILDSRLREKCMGVFEGKAWGSIHKAAVAANIEYAAYVPEGGETYTQFEERVLAGLDSIAQTLCDESDTEVIVTAHGGVIFHLFGYFQSKRNSSMDEALIATHTLPENVSMSTLSATRDTEGRMQIKVVDYNNTKHLQHCTKAMRTIVKGFSGHATDQV